jgi:LmbE family N-acetylglucosaminyl deacetylase
MTQKVLVFAPHPDDAEFYAGGTLARLALAGAQVILITVTDGGCGSFHHSRADLVRLRASEAIAAAAVLGAEPPVFLHHPDTGLDSLPPGVLREQFIRLLRQYRPDQVIVEDVQAIDETHPDHRAVALAAQDALNFAAFPLVHPEHLAAGLQPHFVKEKYFYAGPLGKANLVVDITETMSVKLAAMAAHQSQVEFLVEDIYRQLEAAGLKNPSLSPELSNPLAALSWALQADAASVGAKIGVQYAEAFRYTRFHPIVENLISTQGEHS